ncbi:MAG: TAXI family TRAP transporter solute-binding subunit [Rhodospirillaceae bacterium]|jgi:uncharacterized protein|nr:TAXI family TRAP transporter solute-binding subunit [Rhodospirillaceae bacterium]MBT5942003.1 TAXI family TRAP transporter solute-binding subunit [Rhodospirillaceae bacterium]MBT7956936.1 TAXI family TRAP transporter solute-binding subunit [Rhodospirillaceae bacterium]
MRPKFSKFAIIAAAATVFVAGTVSVQAKDSRYSLGSLAEGTTPFLVNTAWANAVNKYVPGHKVQVSAVGAATRHALLVSKGKMDFTMYGPGLYFLMYQQIGPYRKHKEGPQTVKKISTLFSYPMGFYHPVVYESSGIKNFRDIKGKKVFLGPPAGVATRNARLIVEAMTGYLPGRDYQQVKLGWGPAQTAFQDKKFDVWITNTMAPSPAVSQLVLTNKIRLLPLDSKNFSHKSWKRYVGSPGTVRTKIDPKVYGKNLMNKEPILATGSFVGLAVRSDMDADLVYKMMKAFWDHIDEAHAMSKSMSKTLTLKLAVAGMSDPVHPGALRYYKEKGINIETPYKLTLAQREAFRNRAKKRKRK